MTAMIASLRSSVDALTQQNVELQESVDEEDNHPNHNGMIVGGIALALSLVNILVLTVVLMKSSASLTHKNLGSHTSLAKSDEERSEQSTQL